MPRRSYCGERHPLTRNHAKGETMAIMMVDLSIRVEVNAPDPGTATNAIKEEVALLNQLAASFARMGYKKPEVMVKSWEKGG